MCVIFVIEDTRPSTQMVYQAWTRNDHGGGVAWREEGKVRWKKGLSLVEMQEACQSLPMPFIAHFRIASQGGIRPELCHPFEVSRQATSTIEGSTEGKMLFHNGNWDKWQDWALSTAYRTAEPIPTGKWSDSRAIAWLGSIYGPGLFEFLPEKLAILGPQSLDVFGKDWKDIEGVLCSNDFFLPSQPKHTRGNFGYYGGGQWHAVCQDKNCAEDADPGSAFCKDHRYVSSKDLTFKCEVTSCTKNAAPQSVLCQEHETLVDPCALAESKRSPLEEALMKDLRQYPDFTMQRAEREEKAGNLSKNALKRIRRELDKMIVKGNERGH